MALRDLLYRCPACGGDPTAGDGDVATCRACGARFERAAGDARIRVRGAGALDGVHPPAVLLRKIEARGGPLPSAWPSEAPEGAGETGGAVLHATEPVHMSRLEREVPLRRGGRLVGFAERMGPEVEGRLEATRGGVAFVPAEVGGAASPRHADGGRRVEWPYAEIGSLQVSTDTLQIRRRGGEVVGLRLVDDSPLRWETLLTRLLREALEEGGEKRVTELQPRVVVERL